MPQPREPPCVSQRLYIYIYLYTHIHIYIYIYCCCWRTRAAAAPGPLLRSEIQRNVQRFRGGLVFKAHRLLYNPTLGLRVITKKRRVGVRGRTQGRERRERVERYVKHHLPPQKHSNVCLAFKVEAFKVLHVPSSLDSGKAHNLFTFRGGLMRRLRRLRGAS